MRNIQQIYELADRYTQGKLNQKELDELNTNIQTNPQFAKVFADYLATREAIKAAALEQRKKELLALLHKAKSQEPKTKKQKPTIVRYLSAAAAILLIALVAYFLYPSPNQDLFTIATTAIYQNRIDQQITKSEAQYARLFEEGKYQEAFAQQKEAYATAPPIDKHRHLELQGFALWKLEDWPQAITTFQTLRNDPSMLKAANPAIYYLAITYWKMGQKEKAIALLKRLETDKLHVYSERAGALLDRVE